MLNYYDINIVVASTIDTVPECFALFDDSPVVDLKTRANSIFYIIKVADSICLII